MTTSQTLFQEKLQELKQRPHKRFNNNEDPASEKEFITDEKLAKASPGFFNFVKKYNTQRAR